MEANFIPSLNFVLKHEGGYVNHPRDPGGHTNKGITLATYRSTLKPNASVQDLKNISDADVAKIYKMNYWNVVRGDLLPSGVDYAVFDFAVNSGPSRAARYLQSILGVSTDGIIGPETIAAAKSAEPKWLVNRLCDDRMAFLKRLSTWGDFGKGWTARVSAVRREALKMVSGGVVENPVPVTKSTGIMAIIAAIIAGLAAFWDRIF